MFHLPAACWRKFFPILVAAALAPALAHAQEDVWIGPDGGWWSDGANWADGTAPAPAGATTLTLRFPALGRTSTTHDLSDGFLVNQLLFGQTAGEALTLSSVASRRINLSGSQSRIAHDGGGEVTIMAPLVLNSADTTIEGTGDVTIAGGMTGTGLLVKAGAGTATLSAPAAFSGNLYIQGGTFALAGAGAAQSPYVDVRNGAALHLHGTASAGARLPANQSVSLDEAELRITGDAAAASTVRIGTLAGVGSTLRLEPVGAQGVTLQVRTLGYGMSDVLVRAEALGGASGTAFSRVVADTPLAGPGGLVFGMYAAGADQIGGERFTTYNSSSDAAGIIGLQALPLAAYTPTNTIESPAIPADANVVIAGAASTVSARNTVRTLTFEPGASLTQNVGQTLSISDGRVMVRSGGPPVTISGGAIELGGDFGSFITFGDLILDAPVTHVREWAKFGPGLLTLGAQPPGARPIHIGSGPFRPLTPNALAANWISMGPADATLDLGGNSAAIGALEGSGTIRFGGARLTLRTLGRDFWFMGSFADDGELVIVDGGNPRALREIRVGSGPGRPGITLASGRLKYSGGFDENLTPLTLAGGVLESVDGRVPLIVTGDAVIRANAFLYGSPTVISGPGNLRIEPIGGTPRSRRASSASPPTRRLGPERCASMAACSSRRVIGRRLATFILDYCGRFHRPSLRRVERLR